MCRLKRSDDISHALYVPSEYFFHLCLSLSSKRFPVIAPMSVQHQLYTHRPNRGHSGNLLSVSLKSLAAFGDQRCAPDQVRCRRCILWNPLLSCRLLISEISQKTSDEQDSGRAGASPKEVMTTKRAALCITAVRIVSSRLGRTAVFGMRWKLRGMSKVHITRLHASKQFYIAITIIINTAIVVAFQCNASLGFTRSMESMNPRILHILKKAGRPFNLYPAKR